MAIFVSYKNNLIGESCNELVKTSIGEWLREQFLIYNNNDIIILNTIELSEEDVKLIEPFMVD